jgi:predicted nucleotidyltransferase
VSALEQMIWEELTGGMADILGDTLETVILYGSYARGTQDEESDVDIALILRGKPDWDAMDRLQDFLTDMDIKHGKLFSVVDIDEERFVRLQNVLPFYRNIQKEGVVLWKTA